MSKGKLVRLNEKQYSDLVRAKASHELETGQRLSGLGAAIALLVGLYLVGKSQGQQPEQQGQSQKKPIMGVRHETNQT